jgi:hypothetical protein
MFWASLRLVPYSIYAKVPCVLRESYVTWTSQNEQNVVSFSAQQYLERLDEQAGVNIINLFSFFVTEASA